MRKPPHLSTEWLRHVESVMLSTKNGFDEGDENGMWDALLFCLQTKTPIPAPWPAEVLERYAKGRIAAKKKRGRPAKWLRDFLIFDLINYWRRERILFGKGKKSRPFSESRALRMVQEHLEEDGESLSLHSLKNAYNRIKRMRRSKSQSPYVSPFDET